MKLLQGLQISLLFCRPDHGIAIAVLEEVQDQPSDPIFLLNVIRGALLFLKRVFKILLRVDLVSVLIQKS